MLHLLLCVSIILLQQRPCAGANSSDRAFVQAQSGAEFQMGLQGAHVPEWWMVTSMHGLCLAGLC
jgi:hypothetical protein